MQLSGSQTHITGCDTLILGDTSYRRAATFELNPWSLSKMSFHDMPAMFLIGIPMASTIVLFRHFILLFGKDRVIIRSRCLMVAYPQNKWTSCLAKGILYHPLQLDRGPALKHKHYLQSRAEFRQCWPMSRHTACLYFSSNSPM